MIKINRTHIIILSIVIISLLFIFQCSRISTLKDEKNKIEWNYNTSKDSIVYLKDSLRSEKNAYIVTEKELSKMTSLYHKEKNKKPETVIEYKTRTITIFRDVPIEVKSDSLSDYLSFRDSLYYSDGNYALFSGIIPFTIKDEVLYPSPGEFSLKQYASFTSGMYLDKDDNPAVFIECNNPNVIVTGMTGFKVRNKNVERQMRKRFGIGLHLGYGLNFSESGLQKGINVSIGLNWQPRILQFGK